MNTQAYNKTLLKIEKTIAIATGGLSTKERIELLMQENKGMSKSKAGKIVRQAKHVSAEKLQADVIKLLTDGHYEMTSLRFFVKSGTIGTYMKPVKVPSVGDKRKTSAKKPTAKK
jgi:hypothetical protein